MMKELQAFWKEEDAVAVVEIVLITVVLIAMVVLFRDGLKNLMQQIMNKITKNSLAV